MELSSDESAAKYHEVISILGEKKIEKLHFLMGSEKISFATLRNFIKRREIVNAIKERMDISIIAKQVKVSERTIYRYIKKRLEKKLTV